MKHTALGRTLSMALLGALVLASAALAQAQETLGMATFTPPAGWKREASSGAISFSQVNRANGAWCILGVFTTANSRGSLEKDFEAEWRQLVAAKYNADGPAGVRDATGPGGSQSRTGAGRFDFKGTPAAAILTTYRLGAHAFSVIAVSNSFTEFESALDAFERSLRVRNPGPSQTASTPASSSAPVSSGFAFTSTKFDDGWTSVVEKDWVRVRKGDITVLIHYPTAENSKYFPQSTDEAQYFWNKLVAPRYSNLRDLKNCYNSGFEPARLIAGTVRDSQTGSDVYVALFQKKGTLWMEFITPGKAAFVQHFGKDIDTVGPYETEWQSLTRMAWYNRFSVAPSDLTGTWTSDFSGLTQYVNAQSGMSAGTDTHTSRETFVFGPGTSYRWDLGVASGYVGNIRFQTVRSTGTFSVPSGWKIAFSDIEHKPKTYNAYFSAVRGGRILWLDRTPFGRK